jgi:hypothetical protein
MPPTSVSSLPSASQRVHPAVVIKIDLDERVFVFPQNKPLTHLQLHVVRPNTVRFEATYAFNQNREDPTLFEITGEDCAELTRRLVEAVYRAQSTQVVTASVSIGISVAVNGYILQINRADGPIELFLGMGSIWRVCNGLSRAVDFLSPIASN